MTTLPPPRSRVRLRSDVALYPDVLAAARVAACTGQPGVVLRHERAYGLCVVAFAAGTLWLSGDVLVLVDDDGDGNE